jgi:hypothetical protein
VPKGVEPLSKVGVSKYVEKDEYLYVEADEKGEKEDICERWIRRREFSRTAATRHIKAKDVWPYECF